MIQLYSSVDTWWIGLTDYFTSGDWTWAWSNQKANLSLYADYFQPSGGGSCVVMTVRDRQLQWLDTGCSGLQSAVCQCRGEDCTPPTPSTTPGLQCEADWIDAGGLGCVRFLR